MKVKDIALKEVHCAEPMTTLSQIASMMKRHNVGVIPVCEGKELMGMITDRDMVLSCMATGLEASKCQARQVMTSNPVSVSPDTDLEEAARMMGREQLHRLPVEEKGQLVGILSLGDIAVALSGNDSLVAETLRKISRPAAAAVS